VAEDVRGLSAATATLYGALIGGTFALLGVVIERLMRLTGRVRFEASVERLLLTGVIDKDGYERNVSWKDADANTEASGVQYIFAIDLFNGKEVPTGLRDVRVELVRDDGGRLKSSRPSDIAADPRDVNVINIPPRQFKHMRLYGEDFGKDAADALKTTGWKQIEFVGERPKRPVLGILGTKTYRKTITEPKDWPRR
jgi:hypothetical protein